MNELQNELKGLEAQSLEIYANGYVKGTWLNDETAQEFYTCHAQALEIKKQMAVNERINER